MVGLRLDRDVFFSFALVLARCSGFLSGGEALRVEL